MNRPGQPPQRPPSLGPPSGLGGPFRGPYPSYGMPPRNVMSAYPGLPNHRAQNMVPQPSPGFVQQRTPGFPFGATLQQQQSQSQQQQHPQGPLQPHSQQQPNQPPSTVGAHNLPPHLAPTASANTGGNANNTAPSTSSASEVGLDPNDFPALGSTPAATQANTTSGNGNGSYASQAGTGVPPSNNGNVGQGAGNANPLRDFTADDFPALGGSQQQPSSQTQQNQEGHPPGLNGLHSEQQRQQPGLLNLGPRAIPGMQSDAEKQRHMKLSAAAQAAWNSSSTSQQPQSTQYPSTLQNGSQQPQQQASLNIPPGFPQQPSSQSQAQPPGSQQPLFAGNGNANNDSAPSSTAPAPAPQTPAQQVLMSAADRWGLLGLLAMIKSADPDQALLAVGTDLGTMGLDMQQQGNLYSTFITPWADSSAAHTVEPDFHLPACYNVQPPPPGPNKAAAFSDETLFFMFYSAPRDALQEVAAQELYNRNWRFHKELRVWLTKESGTAPSQKVPGGEQGVYTFWDADNWGKERKEMTVLYADLEEKTQTAFAPTQQQMGVGAGGPTVGRAFQGQGMAAM